MSRRHRGSLLLVAALGCGGCALTDLDLDGGAEVVSAKLPEEAVAGFTLAIDSTQPLELILIYDDGFEEFAPSKEVTWTVQTSKVASVDGDARLRGRGIGSSEVTASYRAYTATTNVRVFDEPRALELRRSSSSCRIGETLTYGVDLRYQHGSTEDVVGRAGWASDQLAVATVAGGVISCLTEGTAKITATLDGLTTETDVRVRP